MEYPQYRKYKNNLSYFKIDGPDSFTEWKKSVDHWERFDIKAKILPDRNYIQDMLVDFELYWDKLTQAQFEEFLISVKS